MIRWLKDKFGRKVGLKSENDIEAVVASMLFFIVNKITSSEEVESLSRKIKQFTAKPLKEQIEKLPSFYLFLEQYLADYHPSQKYSRKALRSAIQRDYKQIAQLENFQLIFESQEKQEVLLGRLFLLKMSEKAYTFLGASGENIFVSLREWLHKVPESTSAPIPQVPEEPLPVTYPEWASLLSKISHSIFFEVESRFNEDFARSFYDATYNELAANYKGLENFPSMIKLLPNKLLDEEKINLLSKQQLNAMLLDKVDYLQKINDEITEKNIQIKLQKEQLEKERKKLEEAQNLIKVQNEKLRQSNILLEDKVEERTKQLNSAFQKLLQANKELDLFVYRTAHDLKGPIARVLGLCQFAQYEEEKPNLPDYIRKLENCALEMNHILSMLLRSSEINNRKIEESNIHIHSLVREVWTELSKRMDASGMDFILDVPEEVEIVSDRYLMKILLENLLSNAIQYRDREKKPNIVQLVFEKEAEFGTVLLIKDNGLGIDQGLENNIFDMFFRGSLISKGPGLGLYEAKCIIKKLKGEISLLRSDPNTTTFKIFLSSNNDHWLRESVNVMVS